MTDVNNLLDRFEQAAKMMKRMSSGARGIPGVPGYGSSKKNNKSSKKGRKGKSKSGNPMKREAEEKALRNKLAGKGNSSGSAFAKPAAQQMPSLEDLQSQLGAMGGLNGLMGN